MSSNLSKLLEQELYEHSLKKLFLEHLIDATGIKQFEEKILMPQYADFNKDTM